MLQQNPKYISDCQRETTFEEFPEKLIWKGEPMPIFSELNNVLSQI